MYETEKNYVNNKTLQFLLDGAKIYGYKDSEVEMGKKSGAGLQHIGKLHCTAQNNAEKIVKVVSENEGSGYDSINTWDNCFLSIGLYNWNRNELS